MKMNKIFVKNKNTNYTIIIGEGSLGKLKKQINNLCPKTKKIGLIIDKNIPNNFKIKIKKQLRKYSVYVYEFIPNEKLKSFNKANDLLEKLIKNNLQRVGDTMISGGVDNMEKYQYMLGQARTYQYMLQEISNLLEKKEQKDEQGNVIDLGKGNPKT